jgi:nicotinamide-nucleotide amidase
MIGQPLLDAASQVLRLCGGRGIRLVTAESCTGGLIAAALTAIPGSSKVFERGYVTYSNIAKAQDLGVPAGLIEKKGAVSEEVARAMAVGVVEATATDLSLAVTGIAGPDGGTPEKPVGLVYLAAAHRGGKVLHRECHFGDIGRGEVRQRAAIAALELTTELIAQL